MNTAAIGVSHHDDVMHLKMLDAVFDGRDHRVVFASGVLVRNNGGDAADHEQVARLASENDGRIGSRIAAGNDERFGTLTVCQLLEKLFVPEQVFVAKAMKSCDQFMKSRHLVNLYSLPSKNCLISLKNSCGHSSCGE